MVTLGDFYQMMRTFLDINIKKNRLFFYHLRKVIIVFFISSPQFTNASYENYGSENNVDFLFIPETFTWREYPRVWTVIKFNDNLSKFSLIYSLEEADCSKKLLRNLSQTWVIRDENLDNRLNQNRKVKLWRELNIDKFEDNLHTFLCTYTPPKKEKG